MDKNPVEDVEQLSRQLAHVTAELQAEAEKIAQLARAIQTRDVIGQAKGILMERYKVSQTQASELLIAESRRANVELPAVAAYLTRAEVLVQSKMKGIVGIGPLEGSGAIIRRRADLVESFQVEGSGSAPRGRGGERHGALGEAKDLLMERYNLDEDQAFDFLVEMSIEMNVNVVQVAMQLLRTENENAGE